MKRAKVSEGGAQSHSRMIENPFTYMLETLAAINSGSTRNVVNCDCYQMTLHQHGKVCVCRGTGHLEISEVR